MFRCLDNTWVASAVTYPWKQLGLRREQDALAWPG
jgi:hypothetical protein